MDGDAQLYQSPFDLAIGEKSHSKKIEAWLDMLFNKIEKEYQLDSLMLTVKVAPSRKSDKSIFLKIPKERIMSPDTDLAASEAIRLNRITLAGKIPGKTSESALTSVAIPLNTDIFSPNSIILLESVFPNEQSLSNIIDLIGNSLGWLCYLITDLADNEGFLKDKKTFDALAIIANFVTPKNFSESIRVLVTDISNTFDCDRVALGLKNRKSVRIEAISNTGKFKRNMILTRQLSAAMEEASDQEKIIVWPNSEKYGNIINEKHSELANGDKSKSIISIPIYNQTENIGVFLFERDSKRPFHLDEINALEALVALLAPLITERKYNSSNILVKIFRSVRDFLHILVGRSHFILKLCILAGILITGALFLIERPKYIVTDAIVQGLENRTISAPFDSFIDAVYVREGEQVEAGTTLVQLDIRELSIERLRLAALNSQAELELDRAIAARDRSEIALIETRIMQIDAQADIIEQQIQRSAIKAPFDALVISGDLTRTVGRVVTRGEPLMILAPIQEYRISLSAREDEVAYLEPGQNGRLRLTPLPERNLDFTVTDLVPVARYENNQTLFTLEARFNEPTDVLLHGMTGSARIEVDKRNLARLWGEPLINRVRMWLWKHLPV